MLVFLHANGIALLANGEQSETSATLHVASIFRVLKFLEHDPMKAIVEQQGGTPNTPWNSLL